MKSHHLYDLATALLKGHWWLLDKASKWAHAEYDAFCAEAKSLSDRAGLEMQKAETELKNAIAIAKEARTQAQVEAQSFNSFAESKLAKADNAFGLHSKAIKLRNAIEALL